MFESHASPLASRRVFARRMAMFGIMAALVAGTALLIGILGYRYIAGMAWVDSLLNASMILGGMGPMGDLPSDGAKVFASAYALFSGLVFISVMGIVLTPAAHRMLHVFHLDEDEENTPAPPAQSPPSSP